MTDQERLAAVKRKLSISWDADMTDARVRDVIDSVSPALASRLGFERGHAFTPADDGAWPLFLNACLYEFSNALDAFWSSYAADLRAERTLVSMGEVDGDAPEV